MLMKTVLTLTAALIAFSSPALADACWESDSGAKLTFSSADTTQATLVAGGRTEDCDAARSEKGGFDVFCGSKTGEHLFRIAAKPGYVSHDILVWRDEAWYPNCH